MVKALNPGFGNSPPSTLPHTLIHHFTLIRIRTLPHTLIHHFTLIRIVALSYYAVAPIIMQHIKVAYQTSKTLRRNLG